MKVLDLKYWKDELQDAEHSGVEVITISNKELSRFIDEIEMLRKKIIDYPTEQFRLKW